MCLAAVFASFHCCFVHQFPVEPIPEPKPDPEPVIETPGWGWHTLYYLYCSMCSDVCAGVLCVLVCCVCWCAVCAGVLCVLCVLVCCVCWCIVYDICVVFLQFCFLNVYKYGLVLCSVSVHFLPVFIMDATLIDRSYSHFPSRVPKEG